MKGMNNKGIQEKVSARCLLWILTCSIFAGEALVMLFLDTLPPLSKWSEALLDSALLVIPVFPLVYFLAFRPLTVQIAERRLAKEWSATFDSIKDLVSIVDRDFKLKRVNKAFADAFGLQPEEVSGRTCYELVHCRKEPHPDCPCKKCFLTQKPVTAELFDTVLNKEIEVSTSPIFDDNGEVTTVVHFTKDITERKQMEEKIQRQNEFFTIILESLTHPFYVIDADSYTVKMRNSAAYNGDISGGMKCYQMTHKCDEPCSASGELCPLEEIKRTKKPVTVEHIHYGKNSEPQFVEVHAYPVLDDKGNVSEIIEYCLDITDRRQAEEEMKKLNEKLEDANQDLKNFVYIASHDLREPMRKISAFGKMLQKSLKGKIDDDAAENLGFMIDGSNRMTKMIEGLLAYSRVSSKAQSTETVNLDDIVKQLSELELSVLLEEKHTTLDVPQPLPAVDADPVQIRQLMQNLIANGMKYQAKGNVPHITLTSKPAANDMVRIEVKDNGIGIAPEYHQAIFNMFKRLHSRNEYEGTGIGLAVCKKIVERHGGKIGVESQPGEGSTFWFTVPAVKESAKQSYQLSATQLSVKNF